jgi:hypothetical protein
MLGCLSNPSWGQAKQAEIVGNPTVNEDEITIRVKVTREDGRPIVDLADTHFKVKVGDKEVDEFKWKSPEDQDNIQPPAWIVVLLDFSGSMQQKDSRGTTKYEGAINAIREFINLSAERGKNIQVSIVPFGEAGSRCDIDRVNNNTLDRFLAAGDFKLQNYLDTLAVRTPCASTNLYEPLNRAVRFLANTQDSRFHLPEDSPEPQPRLSVILLSDGFHNSGNEEQDFEQLKNLLQRNRDITVHTLGYGLTPEQLGKKYKLGRAATRKDIGKGDKKVPEEEFVDKQRLAEIAELTGGIAEFSGDAQATAASLQVFLNSLLGEYEITYTQPNAERGSKHDVSAIVTKDGQQVESKPKSYTIAVFGRSLPLPIRLASIVFTLLLLGLGGVLPFKFWTEKLKNEAMNG